MGYTQNSNFPGYDSAHKGKTSSARRNSNRKPKLSERDRPHEKGLYLKIAELLRQRWRQNSIFVLKTLVPQKQSAVNLKNPNIHCRAAIAKPLVTENAKRRKTSCDDHKTWTSDDCKYVICSDASSFTLFPTSSQMPKKAYILNAWFKLSNMEADLWNILVLCWSYDYSEWLNYRWRILGHFK